MKTYDFTPLFRSTIGFDRLLDILGDSTARPGWPPYNIEKMGDDRYSIKMAIAGFTPQEVEVIQQGNTLAIRGEKSAEGEEPEVLHRGLALRNFEQSFNLADYVKVASAGLENGLLSIDLVREVPEQLRPRRIQIGSGTNAAISHQDNRHQLSDQSQPVRQAKAA